MKILILGGGATGSITAKILADFDNVQKVYIGDINDKNAKKFLVSHPKIVFKILDATKKDDVKAVLKDCVLLINAASPNFNKDLMKIALEAGVHYQDFASFWDKAVIEQLEHDVAFKEKGLVALINASATPGVSNLLVGELCSGLKHIEYIKIRILENTNDSIPFTAWSKETVFDEFVCSPYILKNGKFIAKENFGEEEFYDFPKPFNKQRCYLVAQEDIGTIPHFIKTKYADIKIGGNDVEFMKTLFQLGLLKTRLVKMGNALISPYQFMVRVWPDVPSLHEMKKLVDSKKIIDANLWVSIDVAGVETIKVENPETKEVSSTHKKKTIRANILFPSQSEINKVYPGANYISYSAGLSAAIFAASIPTLERKGVYSAEAIGDKNRDSLIKSFKKAGVKIEITDTTESQS